MHPLGSDTVPKYRVENGAGEKGRTRTINIHSSTTEGWQKPGSKEKSSLFMKSVRAADVTEVGFFKDIPELCLTQIHGCYEGR